MFHLFRRSFASGIVVCMLATFPVPVCAQTGSSRSGADQAASGKTGAPKTDPVLLQMIRDDAVHRELKLTDAQIEKVLERVVLVDEPWQLAARQPVEQQVKTINALTDQFSKSLASILDEKQVARLDQLCNQALGTRMIVRDETAEKLKLSIDERDKLYVVFHATDKAAAELQAKIRDGSLSVSEATAQRTKIQNDERKTFIDSLSVAQKRTLGTLTGDSFDFQQIRRKYPFAPQLISSGSKWIQGDPIELKHLRGQVVAVHFYAFGCINCKRNLPHYNAWHTDYADKGLVVIGIQSPETQQERDEAQVIAAMKKEGIEYPVLFDAQKANWDRWTIAWWPTVILIDKKGFIRDFWEGEMNWQGNPGEKQMRAKIERLIAEQD